MAIIMPAVAQVTPEEDAKKYFEMAGNLADIDVFNNQVLVAVYIRPEKSAGGVLFAPSTRDEDRFQSKAGLILKVGPTAFEDPTGNWFAGVDVKVGDWIMFRASDGWQMTLCHRSKSNAPINLLCRLLDDTAVRARITDPNRVY